MRRRRAASPFSLFSFQDIITSVTGIIVLITLLLSLELVARTAASKSTARPASISAENSERLKDLAAQIDNLSVALRRRAELLEIVARLDASDPASAKEAIERQIKDLAAMLEQLEGQERTLSSNQRQDHESELAELLAHIEDLRRENSELEDAVQHRQSTRIVKYNPNASSSKSPWLVDLERDAIRVGRLDDSASAASFPYKGTEFTTWASRQDKATDYFVLLVRSSAIDDFVRIQEELQSRGFDIGFDLLADDEVVFQDAAK